VIRESSKFDTFRIAAANVSNKIVALINKADRAPNSRTMGTV